MIIVTVFETCEQMVGAKSEGQQVVAPEGEQKLDGRLLEVKATGSSKKLTQKSRCERIRTVTDTAMVSYLHLPLKSARR